MNRTRLSVACVAAVSLLAVALGACSHADRRLDYKWMKSPAMDGFMRYSVWAPKDLEPEERLPVVVFLHGGGDHPGSFDQHDISRHLDKALAAGTIPRVVIALPDGSTGFWENWVDGSRRYRDWVLFDMLPEVQRRYHTQRCPDGCHVMGVSMGGHGTLRFAVSRPDLFKTASALSAPIFDVASATEFMNNFWLRLFVPVDSIWPGSRDPAAMAKRDLYHRFKKDADRKGVKLLLAWAAGDRQGIIDTNRKFQKHLKKHNITHTAFEFEGGHNWVSWSPVIQRVLREQVAR